MTRPDTFALSYRDEEILIRRRSGESIPQIAAALGHTTHLVRVVLDDAAVAGLAVPAHPLWRRA